MNFTKARKNETLFITTLRGIFLADSLVSVFALQRSMLSAFDGMTSGEIALFNLITGGCVSVLIFALGIILITAGKHFANKKSGSD